MKNWIIERGISPQQVKMIGNLHFKYSLNKSRMNQNEDHFLQKYLPVMKGKPKHVVTYLTQTYAPIVEKKVMRWIADAAKKLPNIHFLIKTHPSNNLCYKLYTKTHNIHLLPHDMDLYEAIYHSDLIMTISSNTALEAAILNKSIIVLQPEIPYDFDKNNNDYYTHLARAKAGPVAKSCTEIIRYVKAYFTDASYQKHVLHQNRKFLNHSLHLVSDPAQAAYNEMKCILMT